MDEVDCPECGHRYDSDDNPFCPRCGSLGKPSVDKPDAVAVARQDPTRRRVQGAGLVLIVTGSLWATLLLAALVTAPTVIGPAVELLSDQPGGTLIVAITDNGTPVPNATVIVASALGEPFANTTTGRDGQAMIDLARHAAVNVTISAADSEYQRRAVAFPGKTVTITIDTASADVQDESWVGVEPLVSATRIIAASLLAMYAFVVVAGVAAMRLRAKNVAIAGGAIALVPPAILVLAAPSVGTLLMIIIGVAAIALIVSGRRHFS